jgi:hypothetical protein
MITKEDWLEIHDHIESSSMCIFCSILSFFGGRVKMFEICEVN